MTVDDDDINELEDLLDFALGCGVVVGVRATWADGSPVWEVDVRPPTDEGLPPRTISRARLTDDETAEAWVRAWYAVLN